MLQIPEILNNEAFLTDEINVKWDQNSVEFFLFKVGNDQLVDRLLRLNHKAVVGITAALSEWIFWRVDKIFPTESTLLNTDALWLGQIDKRYINISKYEGPVEGDIYDQILFILFGCLDNIRYNYTTGSYQNIYRVTNLAMLARYISLDHDIFDTWFNDCIIRLEKLFPVQYDRQDVKANPDNYPKFYDSSNELAIPREFFFEPNFDYEKANIEGLLETLMKKIDHSNSLYFKPAKDMIEEGFEGTPYKYETK